MNDVDYINYILQKKEYLNIQDYIDRRSNEILSDDVWLWRVKAGVEGDFPDLNPQDLADLLKKIILEIIHKGGVPSDYYRSDINDLINKSKPFSSACCSVRKFICLEFKVVIKSSAALAYKDS